MRPSDLFDREREWEDLERFVTGRAKGVSVGVLYGRRRQGKSFLLRRLAREHGGVYHMALEEEPGPALQRFADSIGASRGLRPGVLTFADWHDALATALDGPDRLLIIDELPYLLARAPGASIPSALQAIVDASRDNPRSRSSRVIVCGSAIAVMSDLLSGSRALRGRVQLDMVLTPFDFRTIADYYGIADSAVAFHLYAILGGTPGYRDLLGEVSPETEEELVDLVLDTIGNPSHALFNEPSYLLREDPRVTDRALYHSILDAIAHGASTPSQVAARIGRSVGSMAHPLDVLLTAGFVRRDDDILLQRRPGLRLADPIVRFHDLVIEPRLAAFEDRRARPAWDDAQPTLRTQLYGPAFEDLAREWVRRHAGPATLGGAHGEVGSTVVNDQQGRSRRQIDVVVLAEGARRQQPGATIRALGEAKDSDRPRTIGDLRRLESSRELLAARGADVQGAKLLLFGRSGFDSELRSTAGSRADVELVDLERIRSGS